MNDGNSDGRKNESGLLAQLTPAIDQLPDEERIPWELYYQCGIAIDDISAAVGEPRFSLGRKIWCANMMIGFLSLMNPGNLISRLRQFRRAPPLLEPPRNLTADFVYRTAIRKADS